MSARPSQQPSATAKPVDAKPVDAKPVDAKPVDAKPVETPPGSVETPAAAVKAASVRNARPAKGAGPAKPSKGPDGAPRTPTKAQRAWLARGLDQPGGKLPLFDHNGRRVSARLVKACLDAGWAEPWFANPVKPDWNVCKLTKAGRRVLED